MTKPLVELPSAFGIDRRQWDRLQAAPAGPVVGVRDATSVVLVRDDTTDGLQVFLLERVAAMAFAAGMSVFPGGGVDPRDRALPAGVTPSGWAARWGDDEATAAALVCSAVRETFEETGVLLAGPSAATAVDAGSLGALDAARDRLAAGETDLAGMLADAALVVREDLLHAWARWITPSMMPQRYDTRFFLAVVPPGQVADGRTTEAASAGWTTPSTALRSWADGTRSLMAPTWAVLGQLAEHRDTASLLATAAARSTAPVTPAFRPGDDRVALAVPAGALGGGV